jgi:hypothetical protein
MAFVPCLIPLLAASAGVQNKAPDFEAESTKGIIRLAITVERKMSSSPFISKISPVAEPLKWGVSKGHRAL